MSAPESPWMSVPEASNYSRRGLTAIYNACRTGELRASQTVSPGGTWRIHRDDVDAWMDGRKPARRAS